MVTVGLIAVPPMQLMSLAVVTVLQTASLLAEQPVYHVELLSEVVGLVETVAGLGIKTEPLVDAYFDTILVRALVGTVVLSHSLAASVRHLADGARRVGSFRIGAFVLRKSGLLDGRRATTHWRHLPRLERAYPKVGLRAPRDLAAT